jgi:hypothetical protein
MADITTTTTETKLPATGTLPALSIAAQVCGDCDFILSVMNHTNPDIINLFTGPAWSVEHLNRQADFLNGDRLQKELIPRLNQIRQPATEEQVVAFVLHVIEPRTKAGKDEKEAFMAQLTRMVSNHRPMVGVLEVALEQLFETSDGFLPAPVAVKKALVDATQRIQTLIQEVQTMFALHDRGLRELSEQHHRHLELAAELRRALAAGTWGNFDRDFAEERLIRLRDDHLKVFGEPLPGGDDDAGLLPPPPAAAPPSSSSSSPARSSSSPASYPLVECAAGFSDDPSGDALREFGMATEAECLAGARPDDEDEDRGGAMLEPRYPSAPEPELPSKPYYAGG